VAEQVVAGGERLQGGGQPEHREIGEAAAGRAACAARAVGRLRAGSGARRAEQGEAGEGDRQRHGTPEAAGGAGLGTAVTSHRCSVDLRSIVSRCEWVPL
jgi:hypothetical protein